jgi:hypothetical protein
MPTDRCLRQMRGLLPSGQKPCKSRLSEETCEPSRCPTTHFEKHLQLACSIAVSAAPFHSAVVAF